MQNVLEHLSDVEDALAQRANTVRNRGVMSYTKLSQCRVCGNGRLTTTLDLGVQELTGVFPKDKNTKLTSGPLDLVWCDECGLLQLGHSYNANEMYGSNYGYRSGLNASMVAHLNSKVHHLERVFKPAEGDIIIDIGSNDSTTLKAYKTLGLRLVGIDPVGAKFKSFYPDNVELIPDFFSPGLYKRRFSENAKIITSIAMFYDLDSPIEFACGIESILRDDGIWHFEQSYMPSMLRLCSYDTVCHEHLEYYSLNVVKYILEQANLKILDVVMNAVNGGSFAVTAAKQTSTLQANNTVINWLLEKEERSGLKTLAPYKAFAENVRLHRANLRRLLVGLNSSGKKIYCYGASTKGNVVLQYCDLTEREIIAIAEVNEDKFGAFTPGTHIPIISENDARAQRPDYFLVLPWHFKDNILTRESQFLIDGGKFIFPFPEIEII